jgi:hypothetical protein
MGPPVDEYIYQSADKRGARIIIFLKLGSLEFDPTRFSIPSNAFLQNSREKHEIWLEILNLYFPRQI